MAENQKRDPYKNKQKWDNWKEKNKLRIKGISKINSDLILAFLFDMEDGKNISPKTKKGPRSPTTLINLRDHILLFVKHLNKPLDKSTKDAIHELDKEIREGKIKKRSGKAFESFGNYIKDFKSFWGWMLRTKRAKENITIDLSRSTKKPDWVYLTEQQFKTLANRCNPDYKALVWFMYDTGMRVTEGYSIKIKNFSDDFTTLTIPDEISKTFGRVIKLKLCTQLIKEYIKFYQLKDNDYLFVKKPVAFNKYLKTLSKKIFGTGESKARGTYDSFTIYSIRHNASCYWLKRYPNLRGLKYRMGWKREEQATYYHEFLGLADEIKDEDLILSEDKGKLVKLENEIEIIKTNHQKEMQTFKENLKQVFSAISNLQGREKLILEA